MGFDLIEFPYLLYVFGQTGLRNCADPDQTPQNACKTFTETMMYLTKDLESLQEMELTCLFVTTNDKI